MAVFTAQTFMDGGPQRLAAAMLAAAMPRINAAANDTGEQAVSDILAAISSTYGQRQGKKRSDPLASSDAYEFKLDPTTLGVDLVFSVQGSTEFMLKFGALNFGASSHTIAPKGRALANPLDTSRNPKGFFSKTAVTWTTSSGKFGRHFYEEGIEKALGEFGGRL